jgi:hypothetical protein
MKIIAGRRFDRLNDISPDRHCSTWILASSCAPPIDGRCCTRG